MGNGALQANPPTSQIDITTHASDWLWAVFAIMTAADLGMVAWTLMRPRGQRIFHQLPVAILTTAAIAYFCMAADLGSTPIPVEFRQVGASRAIWYVRYIDWTITTPLLLLELLLGTGLSGGDIFTILFFDLVMIITGLVGALVRSSYKWGFFVFGCFALFYVWYGLFFSAPRSANAIGADVRTAYTRGAFFLAFIWALYPIAWGLSDGGNVISPTSEMIFYGILDILAKPVFCYIHIFSLSKLEYGRFGLTSGKFSEGNYAGTGAGYSEKRGLVGGNNAGMTGGNTTGHALGRPSAAGTVGTAETAPTVA